MITPDPYDSTGYTGIFTSQHASITVNTGASLGSFPCWPRVEAGPIDAKHEPGITKLYKQSKTKCQDTK